MATLMKVLEHHPSLTELSIQGSSCLREGIVAIGDLIGANNVQLRKVDLSNHQYEYGGDRMLGVDSLAESLAANSHLKYLSLSGHTLTCEDVECLATALPQKSGLQKLCLSNCDISDPGAMAFAKQIPRMKCLKYLWLHDNPFGEEGATAILHALESNWELEQLMIPRGRGTTGDDLQRKIEFQLILNRGGRKLLREHNVPQALLPAVLSRAGNIEWEYFIQNNAQAEVIFHLLQARPAIFHRWHSTRACF
jgi:Ran GTPase-activating protein (RanGAP) involved in mRNA processing and transport